MITIRHKFSDHDVDSKTETLIIGTFNPDTPKNEAEFFYGRSRNYLWRLLPTAYDHADLKGASSPEKLDFIRQRNIDFVDLIEEIEVDEGQEANYFDGYIDSKVSRWKDVIALINTLANLKRVCFTRKTYADIPKMKAHLLEIEKHCESKDITFQALTTPARFYRADKQAEWTKFLLDAHR